jgi:hypothetical protein
MLGAGRSKTDEINDCIRLECCDARAECPRGVLGRPVDLDATYCGPCRMWHIRLALSTAGDDYVVARIDKSRDEERADVTGPADNDESHYANAPRFGGWGCVVSMNRDATESTASSSKKMLPRIATIALAVTPTGLLMQIIYFFIDNLPELSIF